ncbi:MAG: hypothetical protein LBQ19_04735 [Synergistaceae bacterium]|jgi:prolyl-tRNA synthetase|nr:hypothetical protein [Synergistaceae bacterium]
MESITLKPVTENPPAKIRDQGVINLVKAGFAAYNAKSGELLLLPCGDAARRDAARRLARALWEETGLQRVDCGSDEAIFSVAERYVKEWKDAALSFFEERGRDISLIGWSKTEEDAAQRAREIMSAVLGALNEIEGANFAFTEEAFPYVVSFSLLSKSESGALGARPGFVCSSCGKFFLPESPLEFGAAQPGANEKEAPLEDIETPGADTIAELCSQIGIEVERAIKAMLYVAKDESGKDRPVAVFVRGDYSVGMNKLARWLKNERGFSGLRSAEKRELYELIGEVAGYCGPVGLPENVTVVCDNSVRGAKNTVVGANKPGYHRTGCCHGRDFDHPLADIALASAGIACSCGNGQLEPVFFRESGTLRYGIETTGGKTQKKLAYRDREGSCEYDGEWRGVISTERIILATRH